MQLTKKVLGSIVARLRKGSTLGEESRALGMNRNGPLREALRQHLGSKKAYDELITKAFETRPGPRASTKNKKATTPKKKAKNPPPDEGSSSDDNGEGEPQDLVEAMSGEQEEERRGELEQNGVAGVEAEAERMMSLV